MVLILELPVVDPSPRYITHCNQSINSLDGFVTLDVVVKGFLEQLHIKASRIVFTNTNLVYDKLSLSLP